MRKRKIGKNLEKCKMFRAIGKSLEHYRLHHVQNTDNTQLEEHTDELSNAMRLLKKSKSFMNMAEDINCKYISSHHLDRIQKKSSNFIFINDSGEVESGKFKGRRILLITRALRGEGSRFKPNGTQSIHNLGDVIQISMLKGLIKHDDGKKFKKNFEKDMGRLQSHYITNLTHELAHASNLIETKNNY